MPLKQNVYKIGIIVSKTTLSCNTGSEEHQNFNFSVNDWCAINV